MEKKAYMDVIFYDDTPAWEKEECLIDIDGKNIEITCYNEDDSTIIYKGYDEGHGHFVLACQKEKGGATLHKVPNKNIIEGFWEVTLNREYNKGFWRITL